MEKLKDYFYVEVSDDSMCCKLHRTKKDIPDNELHLTESIIRGFLSENKIIYGVCAEKINILLTKFNDDLFPMDIAKGLPAEHGNDGQVNYARDFNVTYEKNADWNFRDVMRIPSVKKGEIIAVVTLPTNGKKGKNVFGNVIQASSGRTVNLTAGKDVIYNQESGSFYAAVAGQIMILGNRVSIQPVYEVNETLSMKNGNLDFVGNIVIHGDVPSGYTIKAQGDIKIFGLVEAAEIIAGGSIYIAKGFAGLNKGTIKADGNVQVGYINQGTVHTGNDLFVEGSIIHSTCTADNDIYCQKGNIIGGSVLAGNKVEACDIGNRMGVKTEIVFGFNKLRLTKEKQLQERKHQLESTLEKLAVIGKSLENEKMKTNPKLRITLLRQRNSYKQANDELIKINTMLKEMTNHTDAEKQGVLYVKDHLYTNVYITFGKYKKKNDILRQRIAFKLEENEITASLI